MSAWHLWLGSWLKTSKTLRKSRKNKTTISIKENTKSKETIHARTPSTFEVLQCKIVISVQKWVEMFNVNHDKNKSKENTRTWELALFSSWRIVVVGGYVTVLRKREAFYRVAWSRWILRQLWLIMNPLFLIHLHHGNMRSHALNESCWNERLDLEHAFYFDEGVLLKIILSNKIQQKVFVFRICF